MIAVKRIAYRNQRILDAARGERCTVNISPRCAPPDTTVFAHFNDSYAGKGMGQKADDCAGVFACHECHAMIDRHEVDDFYLRRAYYRTIRRLIEKGVLQ